LQKNNQQESDNRRNIDTHFQAKRKQPTDRYQHRFGHHMQKLDDLIMGVGINPAYQSTDQDKPIERR